MTLKQAERVHSLIEKLNEKEKELDLLLNRYESISGYYNTSANGFPFYWRPSDPEYKAIVQVVEKQVENIQKQIEEEKGA